MLNHEHYVREKLRELEREQMTRRVMQATPAPRRRTVVGPALRGTGRLLRRMGEGLEAWAGQEQEPMQLGKSPR